MSVLKAVATVLSCAALFAAPAAAQRADLPDFGSPADIALSKDREAQLGSSVMRQAYEEGAVVEDPALSEYLNELGARLASNAIDDSYEFFFFVVDDPSINAFALPGGFIGVNTGLIAETDNESELAGVLAHEMSHVTQRHIARSIYDSQRATMQSLATMLGAILIGAATETSGDVVEGAVATSQAMAAQRQINFTRANEYEADRIGIELMSNAGFDPQGMGSFFEKIQRKYMNLDERPPPFLLTHPVTSDRVAEARSRLRQLPAGQATSSLSYELFKARVQVREASSANAAFSLFEARRDSKAPADRYGLALAAMRVGRYDRAETLMRELIEQHPTVTAFRTGYAEALMATGATERALAIYEEAVRLFPRNVPLTISNAEALIMAGEPADAHKLLLDLLNNKPATPEQLRLIARAANAEGDVGNSHFYMSFYYTSLGNLNRAIEQLRFALEAPNVHTVDRARFQARLNELIQYLPEEDRARVARGGRLPPPQSPERP